MATTSSTILPLVFEPHPILHKQSKEVHIINDEIKDFSKSLVTTMKYHNGLGLAAVQVGVLKKIIAINTTNFQESSKESLKEKEDFRILINATIVEESKERKTYNEGCLSYGNIFPEIIRAKRVKVQYLDLHSKTRFLEISDNILSACLQHEIDHTNGIVFLDRMSRIKKEFIMKKYLKWRNRKSN